MEKWRKIPNKKAVLFLRKRLLFCRISLHFRPFVVRYSFITNYLGLRYWRWERSHKCGCLTQWHIQQVPFKRYYGQKQGWNYANSFSESSSKLQIDEWQQIPLQHHSFPERWRIFVRVSQFFSIWKSLFQFNTLIHQGLMVPVGLNFWVLCLETVKIPGDNCSPKLRNSSSIYTAYPRL